MMLRALLIAYLLASPAFAGDGRLTEAELRETVIGATERGEYKWQGRWYDYWETFNEDKTVNGKADKRYTGTWEIEGDTMCVEYSGGGDGCFAYLRSGDTYTSHIVNSDGSLGELKARNIRFGDD